MTGVWRMSMKCFYPRSQKCERAQRADRNTPMLQPETEYCLPGSRFALIMRLARDGASDKLFKKKILGIDQDTIRVARKLADGTISAGRGSMTESAMRQDALSRRRDVYEMLEAGHSVREVQIQTGLSETSVRRLQRSWQREPESQAG